MSTPSQPFLKLAACLAAMATLPAIGSAQSLAPQYGRLPLSFEANQGQAAPQIKFQSRGNGYTLNLTGFAAILTLTKPAGPKLRMPQVPPLRPASSGPTNLPAAPPTRTDTLQLQLIHAGIAPVTGQSPLPGTANYFLGNDPAQWHTSIPTYARVQYTSVYPGIDLVYYGNQRQLEYDFVLAPHANPANINLHFAGARSLAITPTGDLRILATHGEVAFHKPVVYQTLSHQRQPVEGRFQLLANNTITFQLGPYDHTRSLTIDPTLAYSTYLGGSGTTIANAIAVDSDGNSYTTGYTEATNFPLTSSPYQKTNGDPSAGIAFVTRLNPAGTALVYSTYLGGTNSCSSVPVNAATAGDVGNAIAVDSSGDAYIAGQACSTNFPVTKDAYQVTNKDSHGTAFLTKLSSTGSSLVYSTYLGGSGANSGDFAQGVAVDTTGHAYVAGQTFSTDFPVTSGAYETATSGGNNSAFVTRFNPTGTALMYSTYLTNNYSNAAYAIAINSTGDAYVTGYTFSGFPVTSNAFQKTYNGPGAPDANAFLTEFNSTGAGLIYSTYLGGNDSDEGFGIAVDAANNAYVTGVTISSTFPTTKGAYQATNKAGLGNRNAFVSKFDTATGALTYSTYLGGATADQAQAIAVDSKDNVYLTGSSLSSNFPTTSGAYQTTNKGTTNKASNAFFTELNPTFSALVYSTYLGGSGTTKALGDTGNGIALDTLNNPYLAGAAYSTSFPTTPSAYQKTTKASTGNSSAFLARFVTPTLTSTSLVTDGTPQKQGVKVTFTAEVASSVTSSIVPTGKVAFSVDGGTATDVTLDDTGHAAYSTTTLAEGVHSITASYLGDANYAASTSAKLPQTIYGAASTLTVVSGSGQTSTVNIAYKLPLTVIVKDAKGDVVPGVTITYTGTSLKFSSTTATTSASGEASVTATPTATGSLTATASAGGSIKTVTFALTSTGSPAPIPTAKSVVTLTDSASNAVLYYTTNGDTPTTSSTKYTGPVTVTATDTLKFIAVVPGDSPSAVRTVTTTIQ